MRKMKKRVLGLILAMVMIISQFAGVGTTTVAAEETTEYTVSSVDDVVADSYDITVTPSATEVEAGSTVTYTAVVTKNGEEVTDLASEGLKVWWWADNYMTETSDGLIDAALSNYDSTNGTSLSIDATLPTVGTYYMIAKVEYSGGTKQAIATVTTTGTSVEQDTYGVVVSADKTEMEASGTVKLTATVTKNGEEITDLTATDLNLWFWTETSNLESAYTYDSNGNGKSLIADAILSSVGNYTLVAELKDANDNQLAKATVEVTTTEPAGGVDSYDITVTPSATEVEAGSTVTYTAVVTKNGEEVTDLASEGLKVWWWADNYMTETSGGLIDAALSNYDSTNGTSLSIDATLPTVGTYYMIAKVEYSGGTKQAIVTVTTTGTSVEQDTYTVSVNAGTLTVKVGETVELSATVKKNDETITDLSGAGLKLWWWIDTWNDHADGLGDAALSNGGNTGLVLDASVTPVSVGKNYIVAELKDVNNVTVASYVTTITSIDPSTVTASNEDYTISVITDSMEPEAGDTVSLAATVTAADGTVITDLAAAGLNLWWYPDQWILGNEDGLIDTTCTDASNGGLLNTTVTLPSVGKYYIAAKLAYGDKELVVCMPYTTTQSASETIIEGTLHVEKIKNLPEDFIMGMDISSAVSEFASGVTYKDFEGNTINNITDFCKFLAENGITHIRVRVWNNPYDTNGNGYGGGNCDVATAKTIADACRAAGMKMLVNFHCSDLWADPGKQQTPKAWVGYSLEQKAEAVETYIGEALATIDPYKDTVDMVQVGNETTGAFVGVSIGNDGKDMCTLFSAGATAVRAYNSDVKVVIHVTNPEAGNVTKWAAILDTWSVDYDILGTSYYPYWHGTLTNLQNELAAVKNEYGKEAMVVETSYAYTLEDSDGHDNTVRVGKNDVGDNILQPFTVQGQANAIRNVMNAVNNAGGLGVFYWEPAWITVGDTRDLAGDALTTQITANRAKWESHGSGWASSYAAEYDAEDAGLWHGGSAVDNEAMFYPDGTPTQGLRVWNYVKTGAYNPYTSVEEIEKATGIIRAGESFVLPTTLNVVYNSETLAETVTWNDTDKAAIDVSVVGTYTINGTVALSKIVNQGTYNGQTTAAVTYTLTIKEPNLITDADDAGFEKGDNFTVTGNGLEGVSVAKDVYAGSKAMHWYSATATSCEVTYNKAITLAPGKYNFEAMASGEVGDKVTLQVLEAAEVLAMGEVTETDGWNNWKTARVSFELVEETEVTLRVKVDMLAEGWGSVDELYLYQTEAAKVPEVDVEKPEDGEKPGTEEEPETEGKPETEEKPGNKEEPETEERPESEDGESEEEVQDTEEKVPEINLVVTPESAPEEMPEASVKTPNIKLELKSNKKEIHVKEETVNKDGHVHRVLKSTQMLNVEISGSEAMIPSGADFVIRHIEKDDEVYAKVEDAIVEYIAKAGSYVALEMELYDGNKKPVHALSGYVTVRVPVPEELTIGEEQQLVVYRLEEKGTLTKCETVVEDGMIIFTTNHFSTYVFVVEDIDTTEAEVVESIEENQTNETTEKEADTEELVVEVNAGGNIPVGAVLLAVIVFAAFVGFYVFAKQRKIEK